jgi:hypothetical protein
MVVVVEHYRKIEIYAWNSSKAYSNVLSTNIISSIHPPTGGFGAFAC